VKTTGAEMNEACLRMTRIPKGADLILNKVSGAPGFWIGNVIVMAGVPSIMQAMLDEVGLSSRSAFAYFRRRCARMRAKAISECNSANRQSQSRGRDRQLSVFRSAARGQHECGAARV
jgi:molybdopterin-biosynthesis enzyme MoeA-like protein